jgi:hypothetical protein
VSQRHQGQVRQAPVPAFGASVLKIKKVLKLKEKLGWQILVNHPFSKMQVRVIGSSSRAGGSAGYDSHYVKVK